MPARTPQHRPGDIRGFGGMDLRSAPPENVGDKVGARVGANVGAGVGGLVSPALVGAAVPVGTGVGAAHATNRSA
jgi:hypothetical protein